MRVFVVTAAARGAGGARPGCGAAEGGAGGHAAPGGAPAPAARRRHGPTPPAEGRPRSQEVRTAVTFQDAHSLGG